MRVGLDGKPLMPPRAGVARYVEGLLQGLGELDDEEVAVEVVQPRRARRTVPWVLWDLQLASGRGFAAFHYPFYYPPLAPRCPYTVAVHDVLVLEHPEWFPRALVSPIRLLLRHGARRAAAVIASGAANLRKISELCGVPRERITVIPYGIDAARFRPPAPEATAATLQRLELQTPYLLQVGALEPRRGLDLSLAAAAALRAEGHDLELVVVGESRAPMPELATPPPGMRALGRVDDDDLPALYAGAAAVLAPSRGEGFDLPVLEAVACGAAVVASDIDVHLEHFATVIEPFASGDRGALTAACRAVLAAGERAAALRAAGPRHAARFTWRECARRHLEVWRRVARR